MITCLLCGCGGVEQHASLPGVETEAIDQRTGVKIRVHIGQSSITIAERVSVEVSIQWKEPVNVVLLDTDWASSQWTLIDHHQNPTKRIDDTYELKHSFLIEPFLAGTYALPEFSVQIMPEKDITPHTLESLPIELEVRSVLAATDTGELDPLSAFIEPFDLESPPQSINPLLILAIGSIIVCSAAVVWKLTRVTTITNQRSAYDQLALVAKGRCETQAIAYDHLYQALSKLDPRLQQTSEIRVLIEQCEQARFSQADAPSTDPQAMARHTLELLGESASDTDLEIA